jgi:hypothetical protein
MLDEAEFRDAAGEIARCLKPGGRLIYQTYSYEAIAALPRGLYEIELPDGSRLAEVLHFDARTGWLEGRRWLRTPQGRQLSGRYNIRYPSAAELVQTFEQAGYRVLRVEGSTSAWDLASSRVPLILDLEPLPVGPSGLPSPPASQTHERLDSDDPQR